ncbi:hypothetical protein MG293_012156 [Ovis ammon polii]|uniref:Uncharacterized protein n=1 Tax=Ovis ammon polii TaxID=230172 RepID=A0AAD4U0I5_OVIAM|nr:hypothetical protein MG293_012156 [Ovis ammon polii]
MVNIWGCLERIAPSCFCSKCIDLRITLRKLRWRPRSFGNRAGAAARDKHPERSWAHLGKACSSIPAVPWEKRKKENQEVETAAPDGLEGAQTTEFVLPFERKDCLPVHASPFSNSVLHPSLKSSHPDPEL